MPEPQEEKKGFWTSLPGILTALAGLLGAVAAIIGLFVVPGGSGGGSGDDGPSHSDLIQQADQLCSQAADQLRQLPPVDPYGSNLTQVIPAAARNQRSLAERLRTLDAPEDDQQKVAHLTALMDQQANEADAMVVAYLQQDATNFELHQQQSVNLDPEISDAAQALGASSCGQSPSATGLL